MIDWKLLNEHFDTIVDDLSDIIETLRKHLRETDDAMEHLLVHREIDDLSMAKLLIARSAYAFRGPTNTEDHPRLFPETRHDG
jgi:hypothetical protein